MDPSDLIAAQKAAEDEKIRSKNKKNKKKEQPEDKQDVYKRQAPAGLTSLDGQLQLVVDAGHVAGAHLLAPHGAGLPVHLDPALLNNCLLYTSRRLLMIYVKE